MPDKTSFDLQGNNPSAWRHAAETLLAAAKAVKQEAEAAGGASAYSQGLMLANYGPYALLLGYAIECLLKGIWLKNGGTLVTNGRLRRIPHAGSHELGQLATAVGVILEPHEIDVLTRLSKFVRFAGRYPISPTWEEMKPREVAGRGPIAPVFFGIEDFATAEVLENRFRTELATRFHSRGSIVGGP